MIERIDKFLMESKKWKVVFITLTMIIVYVEFLIPKIESWWGILITAIFVYMILGIIWDEFGIRDIFIKEETQND